LSYPPFKVPSKAYFSFVLSLVLSLTSSLFLSLQVKAAYLADERIFPCEIPREDSEGDEDDDADADGADGKGDGDDDDDADADGANGDGRGRGRASSLSSTTKAASSRAAKAPTVPTYKCDFSGCRTPKAAYGAPDWVTTRGKDRKVITFLCPKHTTGDKSLASSKGGRK
jgi:hypothetical protein